MAMQSSKFESLISPPWPAKKKSSNDDDHQEKQKDQHDITNFERNDQSTSNLDNIAILGYN
jgi:hypothetical protein